MPTMSTGTRKRETIRTVAPESELTTIVFAPMSQAMQHVACEMASTMFLIWNSSLRNSVS